MRQHSFYLGSKVSYQVDKISWKTFWLINIAMCALGCAIVTVLRYLVPLWSNLPDLNIPPSLNTDIFRNHKELESIYENDLK